jgi:hypothetical protein
MDKRLLLGLIGGLVVLATVGCSSPPPPATPMTWTNYNTQANNDKQISLEGYARLPVAGLVSDTMLVELYEQPDGKGAFIPFSTRIGSSANQVEKPPENYTQSDFKLHANDGSLVGLNDKIRVSGKLVYSPSTSILFEPIEVVKIGSAPATPSSVSTP